MSGVYRTCEKIKQSERRWVYSIEEEKKKKKKLGKVRVEIGQKRKSTIS